MRQQEGGALRGDATTSRHDERKRGRHNERTKRGDLMAAVVVAFDGGGSIQLSSMASAMEYGKAIARQRWSAQR